MELPVGTCPVFALLGHVPSVGAFPKMATLKTFSIHVPDNTLSDLRHRLRTTRRLPAAGFAPWKDGTAPAWLDALTEHWRAKFDWRAQEAQLNVFKQFRGDVDGTTVHFVHERGVGS